jgi:hypothetical protein
MKAVLLMLGLLVATIIVSVGVRAQGPMPVARKQQPEKRPDLRDLAHNIRTMIADAAPVQPSPQPSQQPAPVQQPDPSPRQPHPIQSEANTVNDQPIVKFELPHSAMVGKVIVDLGASQNYKSFDWELEPPADTYFDDSRLKLVLIVVKPGTYTLRGTVTSPTGGLTIVKSSISFVGPPEEASPPPVIRTMSRAGPVLDYPEVVRQLLSNVKTTTRREEAGKLSQAYSAIADDIRHNRIRNEEEFKRKIDDDISYQLRDAEPFWDQTFNTPLGTRFAKEGGNMEAIRSAAEQVSERLYQYKFYGK